MTDTKIGLHPYADLEGSDLWNEVDRAIMELIKNRDLVETSAHPYIVGYICRKLVDSGLIQRS